MPKKAITVVDEINADIPTPAKTTRVRTAPTKDELINILTQENAELKGIAERQYEQIRTQESNFRDMETYYMKKLNLVTDTVTFIRDTLIGQ